MTETDSDDRIERSSGELVEAGGMPARVGGGYRGKRDDQDEAVKEFARRLAAKFPEHQIQIRYNTNRLGGGAWLKTGGTNSQVGLGAKLVPPHWHKRQFEEYVYGDAEKPKSPKYMDPAELNLKTKVRMYAPAADETDCNEMRDRDDRPSVFHKEFYTVEAAWSTFERYVNLDGVKPPSDD